MKHQIIVVISTITGLENLEWGVYIRPHEHSATIKVSMAKSREMAQHFAQELKRLPVVIEDYT